MTYTFKDRVKEWTSYAGLGVAALAAAIPAVMPATSHYWVEGWQALQMGLGVALIFIPQTAGTTAIENEAWQLLQAFSGKLPQAYAADMQPLIGELASTLAKSQVAASKGAAPAPAPAVKTVIREQSAVEIAPKSDPAPEPAPTAAPALAMPPVVAAPPRPVPIPAHPLVVNPSMRPR